MNYKKYRNDNINKIKNWKSKFLSEEDIKITKGAVIVNECYIVKETEDIALIEIDCKTKHFSIEGHSSSSDDICGIILGTTNEILYTDEKNSDKFTTIEFIKYKRFRVFASMCGRYTASVCLYKDKIN
jgi:CCR4-NOT transcriptional regulation complex NOT5 subunit